MPQVFDVRPIGRVASSRVSAYDDNWDRETSRIVLDESVLGLEAALGLEAFSHIDVIYLFHELGLDQIESNARRPRGNPDWPRVGILAQRGRNRPNRLGLTTCRVIAVDGSVVEVAGLDAIDGTPVLDVKPVMRDFLPRGDVAQPAWADEIMASYW